MLKEFKNLFHKKELLKGEIGIEREMLRVTSDGILANTDHPEVFGSKLSNQYITTDFSESQIEIITPTMKTSKEAHNFLVALYDIVAMEIGDEYLWPQSMPSIIPSEEEIVIAKFDDCPPGVNAQQYREFLLKKYGGKKQLVSGIHYNFSFGEDLLEKLYRNNNENISYQEFKNNIYLKIARNYLRYHWLLIYLLGGTGVVHSSYLDKCVEKLEEVNKESFSSSGAHSYRNSQCGYVNQGGVLLNYSSVEAYISSMENYIESGELEGPRELYSPIRLKGKDKQSLLHSLTEGGIKYLEYRTIDINPFDKAGISLEDLEFMDVFNLFLLMKDETDFDQWQEEAFENQNLISLLGQGEVNLKKNGTSISKKEWAEEILSDIMKINNELSLDKEKIIENMIAKVNDYKLTYAYQIIDKVKKEGFVEANMSLSKKYKEEAYQNRFKLIGYEDLELSTQILMKEAIKRGIEIDILDRNENFITLKSRDKIELVKQATKTSKDHYVSVLAMENKSVTKTILEKAQIVVPKGSEYHSFEDAAREVAKYANKPIVIKPKSTNFGIGISIFPVGTDSETIKEAFQMAFQHDQTVLVEDFVKGKEYRILVIDGEVVGILHRVPANVTGDGEKNIAELVAIKNTDPLRGTGYKTPLEKINLDKNVELFLKQSHLDFDSIPRKGEIVYLRENSNISTGGDSIDFTDEIPARFKEIAIESAKAMGARISGVDMMIEDYQDANSPYAIIEMNFNPAIHIHCYPYKGKERSVAGKILTLLGFDKEEKC